MIKLPVILTIIKDTQVTPDNPHMTDDEYTQPSNSESDTLAKDSGEME